MASGNSTRRQFLLQSSAALSTAATPSPVIDTHLEVWTFGPKFPFHHPERPALKRVEVEAPIENEVAEMRIIGDVAGCAAILVDDIVDTAGTIVTAAGALREAGAKKVIGCCTHGAYYSDDEDDSNHTHWEWNDENVDLSAIIEGEDSSKMHLVRVR